MNLTFVMHAQSLLSVMEVVLLNAIQGPTRLIMIHIVLNVVLIIPIDFQGAVEVNVSIGIAN